MLLEPYHKANCIAMLNTLFPPVSESSPTPTSKLTPQILMSQRDGFFRYITAMDTQGRKVLDPLMAQDARPGDSNSWPAIHDALNRYLTLTTEIIDECLLVSEPAHLEEGNAKHRTQKDRKVDSGVSFRSSTTERRSDEATEKPLPEFPSPRSSGGSYGKGGGSALERFAREIRKLGDGAKSKSLKKMKSTSTLAARPGNQHSYAESSFFEIDEETRRRLIAEATFRKNHQPQGPSLHSQ